MAYPQVSVWESRELWVMLFRVGLSPPVPTEAGLVVSGNLQYPVCLHRPAVESYAELSASHPERLSLSALPFRFYQLYLILSFLM